MELGRVGRTSSARVPFVPTAYPGRPRFKPHHRHGHSSTNSSRCFNPDSPSVRTLVRSEGREPRRPWTSARARAGEPRRRCLATSPWNHFGSLAPRGYQRQMSRHDLFRSPRARATTPSSAARATTLDACLDLALRFMPCVSPSAQRLAFSCEVLRERSDRGPRQLQRPSCAACHFLSSSLRRGTTSSASDITLAVLQGARQRHDPRATTSTRRLRGSGAAAPRRLAPAPPPRPAPQLATTLVLATTGRGSAHAGCSPRSHLGSLAP